ncbi:TatD DNase family Scn1 [Ramaria rubella]|nr:TatD DNase family Scn1 [Ramaria rubella]
MPVNEVLAHVVDVHCHPTDSVISASSMDSLQLRICAMATKHSDQSLVRDLALAWPNKVVPCFGYHPWFTHWIALDPISKEQHYRNLLLDEVTVSKENEEAFDRLLLELPEPILLPEVLSTLRDHMNEFPEAMLGEVGLDRSFRIPWSPSPNVQRNFSDFTVPLDHQMRILEAQLQLAVELKRNVSFHSVKAQQATIQLVDRMSAKYGEGWDMISLDMHSCGLSPEMWKTLERRHPNIYMSLSTTINSRSRSHRALIDGCDPNRILAESDYHDVNGSTERTWAMVRIIAEVKGWQVEQEWDTTVPKEHWGAVQKLEENWKVFSQGNHLERRRELDAKRRNRKGRKDRYWDFDGEK